MFLGAKNQHSPIKNQFRSFNTDNKIYKKIPKSVIFVQKAKLTPNFPSNTREIPSTKWFFNENYTFWDFLIDSLSVLNEFFFLRFLK